MLLVEDNPNDVVMIRYALKRAKINLSLQVVRDGREAMGYLSGEGKYESPDYPIPALALLDLHMPRMDGFEVLQWIRQQPHLCSLSVVVLTSSADPKDTSQAYELGANSFLCKSMDFQDTTSLLTLLLAQWLPAGRHRRSPEMHYTSRAA